MAWTAYPASGSPRSVAGPAKVLAQCELERSALEGFELRVLQQGGQLNNVGTDGERLDNL